MIFPAWLGELGSSEPEIVYLDRYEGSGALEFTSIPKQKKFSSAVVSMQFTLDKKDFSFSADDKRLEIEKKESDFTFIGKQTVG